MVDPSPLQDEFLATEETRASIIGFIAELPDRDQEIVRLMFWEDESQTQIARKFGVSKMAISKAFSRIRDRGRLRLATPSGSTGRN